ncbi:MAG TPA: alkaline phosphatase [Thermoanaerobaculia bacterium]|nr:alkaline phosphatase [Thermoanaerobaculia bacterium]
MIGRIASILLALLALACSAQTGAPIAPVVASAPVIVPEERLRPPILHGPPKNVILVIGDGVGIAHVTAARMLRAGEFRMGTMPVAGLVSTASADSIITDSAAAATAMATGVKADNRAISVDPEGVAHRTVLELAEQRGKSTGLLTTTGFWDATPAAFAAHVKDRGEAHEIGMQMLDQGIEIIASTGVEVFGVDDVPPLEQVAASAGYELASSLEEIDRSGDRPVLAIFPSQPNDLDAAEAPLPLLAEAALRKLASDPDGFFLMIEHEGTDTASHYHANDDVIRSLHSLDEAVGVALAFASRDGNTLVLVTGDHETGGLSLLSTPDGSLVLNWSTGGHSAALIPLFAYGPGAEAFSGVYENTEIGRRLLAIVSSGAGVR